jgi:hypothetical protein
MRLARPRSMFRVLAIVLALVMPWGIAAANNDDGFIWIDANTRIKVNGPVKPVGTAAGGATAPDKAPKKKDEKKEKPAK